MKYRGECKEYLGWALNNSKISEVLLQRIHHICQEMFGYRDNPRI